MSLRPCIQRPIIPCQSKEKSSVNLFAGFKKLRDYERAQLPFVRSIHDFDMIIEIGYAEEQGKPLTLKQFFLLSLCSRSTCRRKLASLVSQGVVIRHTHVNDGRSTTLRISAKSLKVLAKYSNTISSISASHFKQSR
jgi:hypothetical protein